MTDSRSRGSYAILLLAMKKRLIAAWEKSGDYIAAAQVLNINTSTARSIIRRYKKGEPLQDQRGGRRVESVKLTGSCAKNTRSIVAIFTGASP